jgi:hypothetical protein
MEHAALPEEIIAAGQFLARVLPAQ